MTARSLESRLVRLQLLLSATVITVFACSSVWLFARALDREEQAHLETIALQMALSISHELEEEGELRLAVLAALEDAPAGMRVEVLDAQRRTVFATPAPADSAQAGRTRSVSVPLPQGGSVIASVPTAARRRAVTALLTALAIGALPLFLATLAVSRALARRALRPLSRMADQADHASREGEVRPLGSGTDPAELAALARSFDRLVTRLDALLQAERHFTRDAAHELRTPLTVLAGELELAASDASLHAGHREALARALAQTRGMSDLVEALLLLRRAEVASLDDWKERLPVNLCDVVRDEAAGCSRDRPDRDADLVVDAPDEVLVAGDAALLAAGIRNLLSNAFKFTAPGQPIRVTVSASEGRCRVVVDDGGPGVSHEEFERIFDPFHRGPGPRAEREGFGLGLPLLRRVARAHGGDVVVGPSTLGGARFALDLPAWPRDRDAT